jgi:O-antigen/teichoic acid export membrane protein
MGALTSVSCSSEFAGRGCSCGASRQRFRVEEDERHDEGFSRPLAQSYEPVGMIASPDSSSLMSAVIRNTAWSALAVIASPILQFLFGGLTLRFVGVEAAGFSLAVGAVLGLAGRFGTCGIGEAALPAMAAALGAKDDRRVRGLIGIVLAVFGLTSVATAMTVVAFAGPFAAWSKTPVEGTTATLFIVISCLSHVFSQVNLAITTLLRAAQRYDLVTVITTPLTLVSGIAGCVLVPLFPSLITIAVVGLASTLAGLLVALTVAASIVPAIRHPRLGFAELPSLARYGGWLVLTHAFGTLTGGVDDLVITGTCGAGFVPPWAIGKRLLLLGHTFLAQHTEHLIPTLTSLRQTRRDAADGMVEAMHWYVIVLAAVGYTLMASCGELIIGAVAGADVASLCRPAISAYSLMGLGAALVIIPVITAMAEGSSRPVFVVAFLSNTAQITAVVALARTVGAPMVYYAPAVALPALILATGTAQTRLFDARTAWLRMKPVLVPTIVGLTGIVISMMVPESASVLQRLVAGGMLATGVLAATIVTERLLSINAVFHSQLVRVLWHALGLTTGSVFRLWEVFRGRARGKPEKVSL